jgi:drug/metabolite transporter (DMT)-like permease
MQWNRWVAFAALCVLSGTSWVIPREMLDGLPVLEQQSFLFGALGLTALILTVRGVRFRAGASFYARLAAAGVSLFGVPLVVVEYARRSVTENSRSALFAMVPVVVVLAVAAGDAVGSEERGARGFLVPALVGVGGLLLLLPMGFSYSVSGWAMLAVVCAAVILAGVASVWLYRLLRGVAFADAVAVMGLSNAVFLSGWSFVHEEVVWRWSGLASVVSISSAADVTELLLMMWLMREMPPVRFASRYLVIPLLTILESYVLIRPGWTVRIGVGTILLAAGAGTLLFLKPVEEDTVLSLQ